MNWVKPKPQMMALWDAVAELQRTWRSFMPAIGLNQSLFGVLMCVAHSEPMTGSAAPCTGQQPPLAPVAVGTIAARLHQSLPAISQKISSLEEQGYITRIVDASDRRVTCVAMTDTGWEMLNKSRVCFEGKLDAALAVMGEEKMAQLITSMQELNVALKQDINEGETKKC